MDEVSIEEQKDLERTYQMLLTRMQRMGYEPDSVAFGITWGQLAESLANLICQRGQTAEDLSEECLDGCLNRGSEALQNQELLPWEWSARIAMENVAFPSIEPESDDEGPLTEQYENWTRIEDGWLDAAYEDRFDIEDF